MQIFDSDDIQTSQFPGLDPAPRELLDILTNAIYPSDTRSLEDFTKLLELAYNQGITDGILIGEQPHIDSIEKFKIKSNTQRETDYFLSLHKAHKEVNDMLKKKIISFRSRNFTMINMIHWDEREEMNHPRRISSRERERSTHPLHS